MLAFRPPTKPSICKRMLFSKQAAPGSSLTPRAARRRSARDWMKLSTTSGQAIPWSSGAWIGWDTTTSGGKLVFHIFGALAEFERDIIRERTQAGLTAARARGRKGGRPRALTSRKAQMATALYKDKNNTVAEICRTIRISRATLYRYIGPASK